MLSSPMAFEDFNEKISHIRKEFEEFDKSDYSCDGIYYECQALSAIFNDEKDYVWQWFIDLEPSDEWDLYEELILVYNNIRERVFDGD